MNDLQRLMGGLSLSRGGVAGGNNGAGELATSAISLVSHDHGRARREERGITKRELQEAVKHGQKEPANLGRDGSTRWRYTYKGIVYITDATSRHEITSWRKDDDGVAHGRAAAVAVLHQAGVAGGAHFVVVVDASGSMRRPDVPGYASRIAAVYSCLAADLMSAVGGGGSGDSSNLVSLIEMRDAPELVFSSQPLTAQLTAYLKSKADAATARSNGNYLPTLAMVREVMAAEQHTGKQIFFIFLSDGRPSDGRMTPGALSDACVAWVQLMGRLVGLDRITINTVAFGPPNEDYSVLRRMASALPRGTFQKLGLSAALLSSAFSSLASTVNTVLQTQLDGNYGGGYGNQAAPKLTLRQDIASTQQLDDDGPHWVVHGRNWDVYCGAQLRSKKVYDLESESLVDSAFRHTTRFAGREDLEKCCKPGVAWARAKLSEGAERVVFKCTEVMADEENRRGIRVGPRLVAKETRFVQQLDDAGFHLSFCRAQAEAEKLCQLFNRRLQGRPEWQIHFLPCAIYKVGGGRACLNCHYCFTPSCSNKFSTHPLHPPPVPIFLLPPTDLGCQVQTGNR